MFLKDVKTTAEHCDVCKRQYESSVGLRMGRWQVLNCKNLLKLNIVKNSSFSQIILNLQNFIYHNIKLYFLMNIEE